MKSMDVLFSGVLMTAVRGLDDGFTDLLLTITVCRIDEFTDASLMTVALMMDLQIHH